MARGGPPDGGTKPPGQTTFAELFERARAAPAPRATPTGPEPEGAVAAPAGPRSYGVAELVRAASLALEARFADLWVEGEVSNLRRPAAGHLYFTLKDAEAQLPAVMFRGAAARLRFRLDDGLRVRCRGRLSIYDVQGKLQLYVEAAEPAGLGALQLAFEQLKARLAAEGLFDAARKRPLPLRPRRVAVVTSPTGAAVRDVLRVLQRRAAIPVVVIPCAVQGADAPAQLVRAIEAAGRLAGVEVVIVGRGGGSIEDLWAFNDEGVARAIAACPRPVVSAVGHEVDFTIADFVADVRAPTPSAAAELVAPVDDELREELATLAGRLRRAAARVRDERRVALERLSRRLPDPRRLVGDARLSLDDATRRAEASLRRQVAQRRAALVALERRLATLEPRARLGAGRRAVAALTARAAAAQAAQAARRRQELARLAGALDALSPLAVLDRGYGLARTADGRVLVDAAQATVGERIEVRLRRGRLDARVEAITPEPAQRPPEPGAEPARRPVVGGGRRGGPT